MTKASRSIALIVNAIHKIQLFNCEISGASATETIVPRNQIENNERFPVSSNEFRNDIDHS